jgi:3-methyladenine DNA glycosylase AlkD
MINAETIKSELQQVSNPMKGTQLAKFFQVFPGGYGEGDTFIGVTVPDQREVAKKYYKEVSIIDLEVLLTDPIHEHRLTSLFMMVLKYQKTKDNAIKESIVDIYLRNLLWVNNWDLVDSSAHLILGPHLMNNDKSILYKFAQSSNMWIQRIAILTTYHFIRNRHFDDTLRIAEILLNHKHDIIHKGVGWMLREVGNRDYNTEYQFLIKHYKQMPRTMLRYAIEKFSENIRQSFLKGEE